MSQALDAITKAARVPKAKVQIEVASKNSPEIASIQAKITDLPATRSGDTVAVILAVTESDLQSDVSRGENAGRRLSHTRAIILAAYSGLETRGWKSISRRSRIALLHNSLKPSASCPANSWSRTNSEANRPSGIKTHGNHPYGNGPFQFITWKLSQNLKRPNKKGPVSGFRDDF